MLIKHRKMSDIRICSLAGEITINTIDSFKKKCRQLMKESPHNVLLNFRDVEYIDSTGLAALIELSKKVTRLKGALYLSNLSLKVRSIFGITKLAKTFSIFETEEEALKNIP